MLRKRGRLNSILLALVILLPCAAFWWFGAGVNWVFRNNLPVYPGAREISNYITDYFSLSEYTLYFWTSDSLEKVRHHYGTLTSEFGQGKTHEGWDVYNFIFYPLDESIAQEFFTIDQGSEEARYCDDSYPHGCVNIQLVEFGTSENVEFPISLAPFPVFTTPIPPPADLRGGTLITFIYYERDLRGLR